MNLDDVDQEQVAQLAREMEQSGDVVLMLSPGESLAVVGHLQLALRHPDTDGYSAMQVRAIVGRIAEHFGPKFNELVKAGWSS